MGSGVSATQATASSASREVSGVSASTERKGNENPKPFIWTKTAEDILESIAIYLKRINGSGQ